MARASASDRKLLETLRERYKRATEADHENRVEALADIKFVNVPGEQWDANMKKERGSRPCLEFNRLRTTIKRVINNIRAQRPSGKVRPTEDADKKTSEAIEGLIRNIWANSDGDSAVDQATEYVVGAGMGAWRVVTKYSRDDAWDQDIGIEPIQNPFCLYKDPASKDPFGRDASYWFLTTRIGRDAYESKYPKAATVDFDGETEFDDEDWEDEDSVRIVEYWFREPYSETLLLLSDRRSVKEAELTPEQMQKLAAQGVQVVKTREVQCYKIKMVIASGDAVLERADWAGSMFPFVQVLGEHMVIDGKSKWWGLVRHAKDAQRSYNYARTAAIETVALSPRRFDWATPRQVQGHEGSWAEAHKKNYPYKLYNPDPEASGPPQRGGGAEVPVALVTLSQIDAEDVKATTGIYDASLGNRSNETSGVAIRQRQEQGEIAVYNYGDNIAKGVRRTWELLVDLIPRVYDTQRQIRILGADGADKYMSVNDGVIDLSRGKYDVTITTGPSFSTQRQEAAEIYTAFAQANPAVFPVAGDLIFKSFDLPYADQIAERLKTLLPPQIQQMEAEGVEMPPEVMQAMAQVEQATQMVQQQGMLVQQAAGEAKEEKAEVEKLLADLAVQRAQFDAQVAKAQATLIKQEAQLMQKEAQLGGAEQSVLQKSFEADQRNVEADRKLQDADTATALAADRVARDAMQQAIADVSAQAAEFMQAANAQIAEFQARLEEKARGRVVRTKRSNGKLQFEVADAETGETVKTGELKRVNGELVGVVN